MMRRVVIISGLLLFAAACKAPTQSSGPVFLNNPACPASPSSDPLTIDTDRGPIHGQVKGAITEFLGVPFAQPPVGALRWTAPKDLPCWTAPKAATSYGSECAQVLPGGISLGNEDCLYLNVWTPKTGATAGLPVMFFLYGGAEVFGSTNQSLGGQLTGNLYDGTALATSQNVVVVSANYRLGPLGFLAHPGLDAESAGHHSGNFGLMDSVAAMEWVQANIASFGGDPSRVMLFGESAGALNTCGLIASPLAHGLFSSALMESGACEAGPLAYREQAGEALASSNHCTGTPAEQVACLRALPAATLMPDPLSEVDFFNPSVTNPQTAWYLGWGPTVDGYVLPENPLAAIQAGHHNHVPLAIGTNADETELFIPPVINTCLDYAVDVTNRFGPTLAQQVFDLYPCTSYLLPRWAEVDWSTDGMFTCPARAIARAAVTHQSEPVYRYLYTHAPSGPLGVMRAFHASELPFVFDNYSLLSINLATAGERTLSADLQGYWSRMAGSHDPNGAGAFLWPQYSLASEQIITLDQTIGEVGMFKNDKCDFWDGMTGD